MRYFSFFRGVVTVSAFLVAAGLSTAVELSPIETLGKKIFFDENLSEPRGQSCAACHAPEVGWTGPDSSINMGGAVYPGAVHDRFGNRKPPASAYAALSPVLFYDKKEGIFVGGSFWDGRATGEKLGNPAADQAQGPFLNPLEHNLPDAKAVCERVAAADYRDLFKAAFPAVSNPLDCAGDVPGSYDRIALAVAAYEASEEVNPFTSKYDYFRKGMVPLTPQEKRGLDLFNKKGKCAECHPSEPGPYSPHPLFTDFTYDNLGIPKNPKNPFYAMPRVYNPEGPAYVDPGLGGFLKTHPKYRQYAAGNLGKHKVPTVRNVDKRPAKDFGKAYGHNGYFTSLKEFVHFYNTRDVLPVCKGRGKPGIDCWPRPEVSRNMNREEMGNLKLTEDEENAIVAFLKTLTDGYNPAVPDGKEQDSGAFSHMTAVQRTKSHPQGQ